MGMPNKLFAFDVFINGESYLGRAVEITPPKLGLKTVNYQGAGMIGSVAVMLGFEDGALDMDITLGGLEAKLLKEWGGDIDDTQYRFSGSFYADKLSEPIACEIQTRGRPVSLDWGSAKQGEDTVHKISIKNTYCKITIDNEVIMEADFPSFTWIVNGKDLLEKHRANMGH